MRVLVVGSSGVIGRQLTPILVGEGHDVVGLSRVPRPQPGGGQAAAMVTADALDRDELIRVVRRVAPDAVVNLLSAIPPVMRPRRMARDFAMTNRLRTEGTRNLMDAAAAAKASRVVAEGLAYAYDPRGHGLADEDAALWLDAPAQFRPNVEALVRMEAMTVEAGGLVLRLGHLYGEGSTYGRGGSFLQDVVDGKAPLVGRGRSTFSFIHAHDAAAAFATGLRGSTTGVLNVVDDEPAAMSEWLPELARLIGAQRPGRVPVAAARVAAGKFGVAWMTRLRGADNSRARNMQGWALRYPSWRQGFTELQVAR